MLGLHLETIGLTFGDTVFHASKNTIMLESGGRSGTGFTGPAEDPVKNEG